MQNKQYESLIIKILRLTEDIVRTSENVMEDPYAFSAGGINNAFDDENFGQ